MNYRREQEDKIYHNRIIDINLNVINEILKQTWRKYLNIYRKEKWGEIETDTIYCLSYIQQDITSDKDKLDYIKNILSQYVHFLNNEANNDKSINLSSKIIPEYKKWVSILLDITSENWEKYKAGSLFVKNYIKRDSKNNNQFYIDEKSLDKMFWWKEYVIYIFYIDKIKQTFSFKEFQHFLMKFGSNENIREFFNFDLADINALLDNKLWYWYLNLYDDSNYEKLKKELAKVKDLKKYTLENFAYFITRKIFSLHFTPFPLSITDDLNIWNRKEILKSSKTEDKLNSTFTNEIFDLALFPREDI